MEITLENEEIREIIELHLKAKYKAEFVFDRTDTYGHLIPTLIFREVKM
jgi:hypothetical protein